MIKFIFIIFLIGNRAGAVGGAVGNGGGFSICKDGKYYAFDYLITMKSKYLIAEQNSDLLQHLKNIEKEFLRLKDPLAPDFSLFIQSLFKQIPKAKYQWFERKSLPVLFDPDLELLLPSHCKKRIQAVIFFPPHPLQPYSSYGYVGPLIQQVLQQRGGALQVSFLLIHEWLWNFFPRQSFQNLAWFNRLLNSDALKTLDHAQYIKIRSQLLKP